MTYSGANRGAVSRFLRELSFSTATCSGWRPTLRVSACDLNVLQELQELLVQGWRSRVISPEVSLSPEADLALELLNTQRAVFHVKGQNAPISISCPGAASRSELLDMILLGIVVPPSVPGAAGLDWEDVCYVLQSGSSAEIRLLPLAINSIVPEGFTPIVTARLITLFRPESTRLNSYVGAISACSATAGVLIIGAPTCSISTPQMLVLDVWGTA